MSRGWRPFPSAAIDVGLRAQQTGRRAGTQWAQGGAQTGEVEMETEFEFDLEAK